VGREVMSIGAAKMPLDKIGQPIVVGSYIAYGHALGRCAGIRVGKVLAVKYKPAADYQGPGADGEWRITVIGVDDDWDFRGVHLCERKGTLQFPSRMIVLASELVPARFRELMDGYDV
jgi:hypothetical protein